jgi:hypothetical protein
MRAALALSLLLLGCQTIVGLEDPVGGECTLFSTDECGDNQMCDFDQDLDRNACRLIGSSVEDQACDGQTECGAGLSCTDGLCRVLCSESVPCNAGGASECLWSKGSALVCDDDCDVVNPGSCGGGLECEITYNANGDLASACVPDDWFGDVPMGDDCDDLTNCVEGLGCIDVDEDGEGVCMPLCLLGSFDCPSSAACDFDLGPLHGTNIGICRP